MYWAALAVLAALTGAALAVGSIEAQAASSRQKLDVWANGWFRLGVVLTVVTVVLAIVFIVAAFVNVPKLQLRWDNTPEYQRIAHPPEEALRAARTSGGSVLGFTVNVVRIDELRGVDARQVQVRVVRCEPPNPVIPMPVVLAWLSAGGVAEYGDIPAHGHGYVRVVDVGHLSDGSRYVSSKIPGLEHMGSVVVLTLEAWWVGRRMASIDVPMAFAAAAQ